MDKVFNQMITTYNSTTLYDKKNAIKEVMQEIVLCGLSRADFLKEVTFYAGTALRIFHGLDRFSEDLDFSLKVQNNTFDLDKYLHDSPSLFAGKIHAVISRGWKSRVKGRDLFDYVFYISENVPFNLKHLSARLKQTEVISQAEEPNLEEVKIMIKERYRIFSKRYT